MENKSLGQRLLQVRKMRDRSLRDVASAAGFSPAYLQKLEKDQVKSPSPNRLHALAKELKVPYSDLMELAGYVVPKDGRGRKPLGAGMMSHALSSEDLTDEEANELAKYLAWFRSQQGSRT
jgi:transcriptional regulator with XRE-family HTH domain